MPDKNVKDPNQNGFREPVIVQDVSLSLSGVRLIHSVSMRLEAAGVTVLMGANGAGKSLLLRLVAGLLQPDGGRITGCGLQAVDGRGGGLSIVFQKPVLLRRSVSENLSFVLDRTSYSRSQIAKKVDEALHQARIAHRADVAARALSGGEQQRLALARALVVEPAVLLADEVTASLDPASSFVVEEMVRTVARCGARVVFVTHDVRQAKRIADDVLFMHEGRILAHKPAKDFFRDPGSPEAQAYLDGRLYRDETYRNLRS